jgi:hypothetical protein
LFGPGPPAPGRPRIDLLFAGQDPMLDTAADLAVGDKRARAVALLGDPSLHGLGLPPPVGSEELMRPITSYLDPWPIAAPPYPRAQLPSSAPLHPSHPRPSSSVLLDPRLDPIFQPGVPNPGFAAGKIAAEAVAETALLRDAQGYAQHRRLEADAAAEAVFARGASRRVAELHRAEEKLAVMRDNAALRTEHTFLLLEEENARLADEKQRIELQLKALETELYVFFFSSVDHRWYRFSRSYNVSFFQVRRPTIQRSSWPRTLGHYASRAEGRESESSTDR